MKLVMWFGSNLNCGTVNARTQFLNLTLVPVNQIYITFWRKKNRIGYILKSADVRTQVSSRYSENSSHTHQHTYSQTSAHFCAYPYILRLTCSCTHQRKPVHTSVNTWAHLHTWGQKIVGAGHYRAFSKLIFNVVSMAQIDIWSIVVTICALVLL